MCEYIIADWTAIEIYERLNNERLKEWKITLDEWLNEWMRIPIKLPNKWKSYWRSEWTTKLVNERSQLDLWVNGRLN